MYFRTLFLLACLAAGPALAEDCLEVIGHSVGEPNQGYGIVEIEWQAEVRNHCEDAYHASVTLDFMDETGSRLHQSQTDTVVNPGPAVQVTKLAMLGTDQARRISETRISIDARALP